MIALQDALKKALGGTLEEKRIAYGLAMWVTPEQCAVGNAHRVTIGELHQRQTAMVCGSCGGSEWLKHYAHGTDEGAYPHEYNRVKCVCWGRAKQFGVPRAASVVVAETEGDDALPF